MGRSLIIHARQTFMAMTPAIECTELGAKPRMCLVLYSFEQLADRPLVVLYIYLPQYGLLKSK